MSTVLGRRQKQISKNTEKINKACRPNLEFTDLTGYQRKMQIFNRKWTIWDKFMEDGTNNMETYRQNYHDPIGAGPSLFSAPARLKPWSQACVPLLFRSVSGYIWLVFYTTPHFPPLTHRWRCTKLSVRVSNSVYSFFFLFSTLFFYHSSRVVFPSSSSSELGLSQRRDGVGALYSRLTARGDFVRLVEATWKLRRWLCARGWFSLQDKFTCSPEAQEH